MVAVFGAMAADVLHGGLHVSYLVSTAVLAAALIVIFAAWYRSERTLSIHSIYTRRREAAYFLLKRARVAGQRLETRSVFTFWLAYILTRPLGASFADWAGKARTAGGLGYGDGTVSAVTFIVIVVLVGYLAVSRKDVASPTASRLQQ
jgi:uncharacterized membrane-anchored protein